MNSISVKIPEYFHREYANDVNIKAEDKSVLNQCKRIACVALPFISLYKPAGFALSLGMGSCRALSDTVNLYEVAQAGTQQEILDQLLQTAVSISAIACTILEHPLGMLVTTGQDLAVESFALVNHVQKGEYGEAIESAASIVNNALYLCMFVGGGLELSIASLATQMLIGLYQSRKELLNENYPEAIGHLAMAMIRGNQMLGQVHTLQLKWEANAKAEEQKIADLKKMGSTIEDLQKKLVDETAKLEDLQKNTSTELDKNTELLKLQKTQLIDLQQKLLDAQHLQDILVSYGNNPDNLPAFHYAIKKGDKESVELMLQHGVNIEACAHRHLPDVQDLTALHQAALSGQAEIVDLLLQYGADVNAKSINFGGLQELAAIHYAAQSGNAATINCLISHGADINMNVHNIPSNQGCRITTALHIASELGNYDAVVALINLGAIVNTGSVTGRDPHQARTPLDLAAENLKYIDNPKNLDLVKFLVEHGATRNKSIYNTTNNQGHGSMCVIISGYLMSKNR